MQNHFVALVTARFATSAVLRLPSDPMRLAIGWRTAGEIAICR